MPETSLDTEPLWASAEPLPVPEAAREVDLALAFRQLVVRAGALKERREEAVARQREQLLALIEVYDGLTALAAGGEAAAVRDGRGRGVEALRTLLLKRLAGFGVKQVELDGRLANTDLAEVVDVCPTDECPPETVVQTVRACFLLDGRVLRRGQVFAAVPAPRAEARPADPREAFGAPPAPPEPEPENQPEPEPGPGPGPTAEDDASRPAERRRQQQHQRRRRSRAARRGGRGRGR